MKVIVKIAGNIKPSEVAKKVMADKTAFREALKNGTIKTFANKSSGRGEALPAQGQG